jgi:hypothetical protein
MNNVISIENIAVAAVALAVIGDRHNSFVWKRQLWDKFATNLLD